jgi:hypothetical protein
MASLHGEDGPVVIVGGREETMATVGFAATGREKTSTAAHLTGTPGWPLGSGQVTDPVGPEGSATAAWQIRVCALAWRAACNGAAHRAGPAAADGEAVAARIPRLSVAVTMKPLATATNATKRLTVATRFPEPSPTLRTADLSTGFPIIFLTVGPTWPNDQRETSPRRFGWDWLTWRLGAE